MKYHDSGLVRIMDLSPVSTNMHQPGFLFSNLYCRYEGGVQYSTSPRIFYYIVYDCTSALAPLLSLATSGRIRASVLSTGSSSPSCFCTEALLKLGKKKASSLLAWSLSSLPCTALNTGCVPYCARKLQEARGERSEESRWLLCWCSTKEKHNVWVCLMDRTRMCCSFSHPLDMSLRLFPAVSLINMSITKSLFHVKTDG